MSNSKDCCGSAAAPYTRFGHGRAAGAMCWHGLLLGARAEKFNRGHPARCDGCQEFRTVARCGPGESLTFFCAVCFRGWYEENHNSSACLGEGCVAARQRPNDAVAVPHQPAAPAGAPIMEYPQAFGGAGAATIHRHSKHLLAFSRLRCHCHARTLWQGPPQRQWPPSQCRHLR